ncbi:unnamed protein product, partial [Ixodes pacificus]
MLLISATCVKNEAIRPVGLSSAIAKMGIQLKGEEPTRISSRWAARREVRIPEMNGRQPRRARHRLLVCSRCKTRSPLPRSLDWEERHCPWRRQLPTREGPRRVWRLCGGEWQVGRSERRAPRW